MSLPRTQLLACVALGEFLELLRGNLTQQQVADRLLPHGGPRTGAAIHQYESGARGLSSRVQLAYVHGFDLDDALALHLQRLAGRAVGAQAEAAA